jgi:Domain of unknown function (DUF4397)
MKRLFIAMIAGLSLTGCGKENNYTTNFASATFINASPSVNNAAPRPGINIFVDTLAKSASVIAYRSSTGYLGIEPGSRKLELRTNTTPTAVLFNAAAESFEANKASSFIIYDTLSATNTSLKVLRLNDDLSLPTAGNIKVRFLHLANNAPAVDLTLVRTSVTPNDSVTLTNRSYIGASPVASTLEPFASIPQGAYTLKVKLAGTQTVALTAALSSLNAANGIFTLYAAGTTQGQALTANVVRHY